MLIENADSSISWCVNYHNFIFQILGTAAVRTGQRALSLSAAHSASESIPPTGLSFGNWTWDIFILGLESA